ncbi:MAG: Chromosome (plasmid) partitioning protein ParB, partial [uncultured Ramlibacter sp.]
GDQETQGTRTRPGSAARPHCHGRRRRGCARRQPGPARLAAAGRHGAGHVPAANADGRRRAVRTGREHQGAGDHAADPGAPGRRRRERRQVRDHRGRAPLPRRQAGGPGQRAGAGARRAERIGRGDVADREHPARRPEPARGGAGPEPAGARFRPHARTGGPGRRPLAQRRDQPAAPAEPGRPGADHADGGRPRHGPCPCAAGPGARRADHGRQPDRGQEAVGARGRVAGQAHRRRVQPGLGQAEEGKVARPEAGGGGAVGPAHRRGRRAGEEARQTQRPGRGNGRSRDPVRLARRTERIDRAPARRV